jgi:tRNA U34 5-carboxymethylaminomethyl modifying GTPase MnmE/TrmE
VGRLLVCRAALQAEQFGHITGRFETEKVLDIIFSEFCIGK